MKLFLPNSAFIGNIDSLLKNFDPSEPHKLEIATHDKWISLHPVVLAMVAALGAGLEPRNIHIDEVTARSGHYLERMGLFRMLGLQPQFSISEHDSSGRFVPLTRIEDAKAQTKFITEMIPMLHLEPQHAEPLEHVMSELVRNVIEHAASPCGALVAAQYYPSNKMIRIGIADAGLGIRQTIAQSHAVADDLDAIKLALMPGITGTTPKEGGTAENAGAGLFIIKSIAAISHNYFMIYSGDAMYKLKKGRATKRRPTLWADPNRDAHSELTGLPVYHGTVVGIDISLEATSEFTALLDLIRSIYAKAISERRKARYKKARFI